jgi:hypothetical protein
MIENEYENKIFEAYVWDEKFICKSIHYNTGIINMAFINIKNLKIKLLKELL